MLEIELFQFGCYVTKQKFEFPDVGLFLLEGESGSGKSTILKGINFALFGDRKSTIISFGEKTCTVTIKYDGFTVTRMKGPNKLTVEYEGNVYDGESAQELINNHFGEDFSITSYITQERKESFFYLNSTDRMAFLEKIAIGGIDVSLIKKKCNDKIRDRKKRLNEKSGELKVISEEFKKLSKPIEVDFPLIGKYSDIKIQNEEKKRKNNEIKLKKERKTLTQLQTDQSEYNLQLQKQQQLQEQLNSLNDEILRVDKELKTLNLQDINQIKNRIEFLRINKELLTQRNSFKNDQQQLKALSVIEQAQLQDSYDQLIRIPVIENKTKELKSKLSEKQLYLQLTKRKKELLLEIDEYDKIDIYIAEIEELQNREQELMHEKVKLKDQTIIHKCPNCSIFLKINNSKLEKMENYKDENKRSEKEIDIELKTVRKDKNDYISNKTELESFQKELKLIETKLEKYNSFDDTIDYEKLLTEHSEEILIQNDRQNQINSLKRKIDNEEYSATFQSLKRKLEVKEDSIKKLEYELKKIELNVNNNDQSDDDDIDLLRSKLTQCELDKQKYDLLSKQKLTIENKKNKVIKQLNEIELPESDYTEEIKISRKNIKEYEDAEIHFRETAVKLEKYMNYKKQLEEYNKWETKLNDMIFSEQKARESLIIAETLLRKIKETESSATTNIIANINTHLQFYLEKFFNDPIFVEIVPFEETKTGEKKPCINIQVSYKGSECELDNLSGGERARVELAICLSINNLIGSKILLLDEVFAWLNERSIDKIVEVLKNEAHENEKLIICIAHQAVEGEYDNVLSLDKFN